MTKEELLLQHPELAAELRAEGAAAERARYDGHVKLGRQSGGLTMALADYESGTPVTGETMTRHMDHAMRARQVQDRADDDAAAAAALDGIAGGRDNHHGTTALAAAVERITAENHIGGSVQ